MGSGLIYAALVVMWAAYFIPRWLRRHEELSEQRSVEKFDRAMRILSRREPKPDQRYVVMPPKPAIPAPRAAASRARVSPVTFRRRRRLALLMLATVMASAAAPVTAIPWWGPLIGVGLVVAYLVHCRLQVRTRRQVDRTREAVRKRYRSRFLRLQTVERLLSFRRELAEQRAADQARWEEAEEALHREREAEEVRRREAEREWSPVNVPLPTYVTKPPAPRPEAPPQPAASTAAMSALMQDAEVAEDELDAIITRRAVND